MTVPPSAPSEPQPSPAELRVSGRLSRHLPSGLRRLVLILTGIVYLVELGRLVAWLFGRRATAELILGETAIRARTTTVLLGARTGDADLILPFASLRRLGVERAAGGAFLWAGGGIFVAAVAVGVMLLFRGRVGFGGSLGLAALAFLALGLAVDVGAYALVQRLAARERARLEVETTDGRRLVVAEVPRAEAERFVDEVARRLPKPRAA
jgi:hypothetical protein